LHCKLRNHCSSLNNDLFRVNIEMSPQCRCGSPCENAYHFFLERCLYNEERRELFASLSNIVNINFLNIDMLLFGNVNLTVAENVLVFQYVHRFIKSTNRI